MIVKPLYTDKQAYDTHYNYIKCLCKLLRGATLSSSQSLAKIAIPEIETKSNLIKLTKISLRDEHEIVKIDEDYSYASTSWLPIKSYYLIFNILLTIEYIIKTQNTAFKLPHTSCIKEFTRKLETGEITFSEPLLNQVFDRSILNYKGKAGANLSSRTGIEEMYKMTIRKIAMYKNNDWKTKEKINLHKNLDKAKYETFLSTFKVSIFDFPYLMRIRSNYRDFAFIDNVTNTDTANYFKRYFAFTMYFVKALESLKDEIIIART